MTATAANLEKPPGWLMKVLAAVLLFGAWLGFLQPLVKFQFWQSDTFWLIEVGRLIVATRSLPAHDPYSFTAGPVPWTVYQWLTEVIFAGADAFGGLTAVAVVGEMVLGILFCVLIFRRMIKEGTNPIITVAVIWLAAYCFYPDLSALRPQLFSFLLFWLLAVVCADIKAGVPTAKTALETFVISVVWANSHISFLIGALVIFSNLGAAWLLYKGKLVDKQQPIAFAVMMLAFVVGTLFTPYGFGLWMYLLSVHNVYYTQEVLPLAWLSQPRLIVLALVSLFSCWYMRKNPDPGSFFALIAMVITGNNCGRLIVYFCILTCPVIGKALTELLKRQLNNSFISTLSAALIQVAQARYYVASVLLLSACVVVSQPIFLRRNVPVQAARYLNDHPLSTPLFTTAHAGSYLIYSSHGAIPVFIDTRMDVYDTAFVERFARAIKEGDGWQELFKQYKIGAALMPNDTFKLQKIIESQPDWKPVYRDPDFTLYVEDGH